MSIHQPTKSKMLDGDRAGDAVAQPQGINDYSEFEYYSEVIDDSNIENV